jgi:hypothetical protein
MAETNDSRGKDPLPRKNDPTFSHSPDADTDTVPAGMRRPAAKAKKEKKESWFQQNQTLAVGTGVGVTLLVVVLGLCWMSGLFGGPAKPKPVAAVVPANVPPTTPPSTPQNQPPAPEVKKEEPKKEEPKKEAKPSLPSDVAKWKQDDYARARRENDPKLLQAIARLCERFPGNKKAAQCLTDLLKPLPPEKPATETPPTTPAPGATPPPGTSPRVPPSTPPGTTPAVPQPQPINPADLTKLVETIIEALGCNGSELARGTLEQVLAGTFVTDDDKTAVEATLKTLVGHPSHENDSLLLRVLTAADTLRPAGRQGPWTAKDMQAKAVELVKQSASSNLRTKWAAALVDNRARFDSKDPIEEFLLAANPLNCGAQVMIYDKAKPNRDVKIALEQQFITYSSLALAKYLGVSSENLPGVAGMPMGAPGGFPPPMRQPMPGAPVAPAGEAAKPAEIDLGPEIASLLWSDDFCGIWEPLLTNLRGFDKQPQLLVLAATIPHDSIRAILFKTLRKHREEGSKSLETAGLFDRAITDPAFLVMVKKLPRKESTATPRYVEGGKATGRSVRPTTPSGGGRLAEAAQKKLQIEQDWMDVSAKLVSGWCKRFEATMAAKEKSKESDKLAADSAEAKLPDGFELPPGAKVVASHHVSLPDAAPAGFAQVHHDTLDMYYIRVEQADKPKKAIRYYKGQAKVADARTIDKKVWLDSLKQGSEKDRCRSIDVLISRSEGLGATAAGLSGDDEVDLVIEILVIEVKDPSKDTGKD